ncbi:MAG: cbb3-type cytochrome oxidase assembly protein CcoS [Ectothiorhodospiraceae bacterium]|nr:cbb3-type cytochrome oxidase assembly protein CcoS [Ectothiorhodospiraceae bacterium]MCH8503157.1 cbb3-type cytochrome oxidase assembly protein CcoS [Ectothiorhodospiraceae bacterium]
MTIVYISIPISLILVALGVWAFFWAVRSGQYDDLDTPAYSVLLDEETDRKNRKSEKKRDDQDGSKAEE